MKLKQAFFLFLLFLTVTVGCNLPNPQASIPVQPTSLEVAPLLTEAAAPTVESTPTVEPKPVRTLRVCIANEPESLFFLQNNTRSAWAVLDAIYDGPFDQVNGEEIPVIFSHVDIKTEMLDTVPQGTFVANTRGEAVLYSDEISAETSSGLSQTTITFTLKDGLRWSDNEPLTAQDSVFSYRLSSDPAVKTSKRMRELTVSYEAADPKTIVWKGVPGFLPATAASVFWLPLPQHKWEGKSAADLLSNDELNRSPLGWGAYQMKEWEAGQRIVLQRNASYAVEDGKSEPWFDEIEYLFYGSASDNNLTALKNGTCDLVDVSVNFGDMIEPILEDVRDGKIAAYFQSKPTLESLVFNLAPIESGKGSFFDTVAARKGIAQCVNRAEIIRETLYGQSDLPEGFAPVSMRREFAGTSEAAAFPAYDVEAGRALLTEAGWINTDQDETTPRVSKTVEGVVDGTEFRFHLALSDSPIREKAGQILKHQLAECGIAVELAPASLGQVYQPGPEGDVFGRKFDAVLLAWASDGKTACTTYLSDQIPTQENQWIGMNVGGFSSDAYDQACLQADSNTVENALAAELPALPLFYYPSIGVSAQNLCGVKNVIGMRSLLWNVEQFSLSDSPCAVSQWETIYP